MKRIIGILIMFTLLFSSCKNNEEIHVNEITITLNEYDELKKIEREYQRLKQIEIEYSDLKNKVDFDLEPAQKPKTTEEMDEDVGTEYNGLIASTYHTTDFVRETPNIDGSLITTVKWTHIYNVVDSKIDDNNIGWYKIELDDGRTGWIESRFTDTITENEEFTNVAEAFASAINNRDMNIFFKQFDDVIVYGSEQFEYVFKHYDALYGDSKIVNVNLERVNGSQNHYLLTYDSGKTQEITISYDNKSRIGVGDTTIYYSHYMETLMNDYVKALREKDWEMVVSILYPIEYQGSLPEYDEHWLYRYELHFDVEKIDWKLNGREDEWNFECVIYGEKDSRYYEHIVTVGTGDSLIWIEDDFLEPEFIYWDWDY